MAELNTPFDYRNILIGEEIIYRALLQQEDFARQVLHGAEWTDRDQIEKSGAYFKSNVLRADFAIPAELQHCLPKPPCPWDKQKDEVEVAKFKPIVTGSDGVYTYQFLVKRLDTNQDVIRYSLDSSKLHASIRSEFSYFEIGVLGAFTGPAIIEISKFHRGTLDYTFKYRFDMK